MTHATGARLNARTLTTVESWLDLAASEPAIFAPRRDCCGRDTADHDEAAPARR
jgi:hypothetical protein